MKRIGIFLIFIVSSILIFLALNFLINDELYLNNNKPLYKYKETEEYKLNTIINKRYTFNLPKGLKNKKNSFYLDLYNEDINIKIFYSHNFVLKDYIKKYKNYKSKGIITYKRLELYSYIDKDDNIHSFLIKNNIVLEVISKKYSFNFNILNKFISYQTQENIKFNKLELRGESLVGNLIYKDLNLKLILPNDLQEKEVLGLDNIIRLEKDNKRIVIKILEKIDENNYEKYQDFYIKKIDKYVILIKKVKNYYYLVYFYNINFDIDYMKKYFNYIVI
jgi:hypothetical protein